MTAILGAIVFIACLDAVVWTAAYRRSGDKIEANLTTAMGNIILVVVLQVLNLVAVLAR